MSTKEKSRATEIVRQSERLLTVEEAAERLNATNRQVVRWSDEGMLEFVKYPRGRRIPESSVERFISARIQEADER
ncbi:MAG: excisionase family DNA-binding protein [Solirubrobacterales bacterium]